MTNGVEENGFESTVKAVTDFTNGILHDLGIEGELWNFSQGYKTGDVVYGNL